MAARFSTEEVIDQLFANCDSDENGDEDSDRDEAINSVDEQRVQLKAWIDTFEGSEVVNLDLFKEKALELLHPLLGQSSNICSQRGRLITFKRLSL